MAVRIIAAQVLHDHGITKERLASYERAITKAWAADSVLLMGQEPYLHGDAGRLIMEFENYLRRAEVIS